MNRNGEVAKALPTAYGGRPFRAIIMAHNWRGGCNLCIGAEGYDKESFVVLDCTEEERRRFPVGTQFDLVCVEETRGTACECCGGSGRVWSRQSSMNIDCSDCGGSGRARAALPSGS